MSAEAEPQPTAAAVRDDPFVSVEAMLRFKAAELRRCADEAIAMLPTVEERFKLPKPNDGLPDAAEWAFGEQTPHEVAKQSVESNLRFCLHWLNKTDAAVRDGDYPMAVLCLMHAQSVHCYAWTPWQSSGALKTWRYVQKRRASAAANAAKGTDSRTKYSAAQLAEWRTDWPDLRGKGHSVNSAARVIAKKRGLSPAAIATIRRKIGV